MQPVHEFVGVGVSNQGPRCQGERSPTCSSARPGHGTQPSNTSVIDTASHLDRRPAAPVQTKHFCLKHSALHSFCAGNTMSFCTKPHLGTTVPRSHFSALPRLNCSAIERRSSRSSSNQATRYVRVVTGPAAVYVDATVLEGCVREAHAPLHHLSYSHLVFWEHAACACTAK